MSDFTRTRLSSASNAARGLHYRIRVFRQAHDLTHILDERMTSGSEKAQPIDDGDADHLILTADEVRWLHDALGELRKVLQEEGT